MREDDGAVTGLVVSAALLQEGPETVVEFVLHEAAHILNWTRNVSDTTMRGVYHNGSFLSAAEEVGLHWPDGAARIKGRGYSEPVMSDAARERYASDVASLTEAIPQVLPHLVVPVVTTGGRPGRLTLQCQCDPPRKVRVGKTVAALGPITCGICKAEFTEE
ncbi:hypothetical protein [Streptomyces sp. NPDC005302]|uniref:hypothetical protein n=1 Tax=Streptomyces sp. NPDC005302 TaxID=3154675 RepID=UPI0033AB86E3